MYNRKVVASVGSSAMSSLAPRSAPAMVAGYSASLVLLFVIFVVLVVIHVIFTVLVLFMIPVIPVAAFCPSIPAVLITT